MITAAIRDIAHCAPSTSGAPSQVYSLDMEFQAAKILRFFCSWVILNEKKQNNLPISEGYVPLRAQLRI